MNTLITKDINITDIHQDELHDLSVLVANRQKNAEFMRFLKEQPMTAKQNLEIFQKEFDAPHTLFRGIHVEWIQDMVWFLLFHCFNAPKNEIEIGFRVDPLLQKKWICTQAVQESIAEVLAGWTIDTIVGWHSARNRGSFGVFRKSWFELADFVANQTFLPNIGKITDDFKRQISKESHSIGHADANSIPIHQEYTQRIHEWLQKHDMQQR